MESTELSVAASRPSVIPSGAVRKAGRIIVITALVNSAVAGLVVWLVENSYADLWISAQVVGFTILCLLLPAMQQTTTGAWRYVLIGLALVAGAFFGTVLVVLVKGRDLGALFADPGHLHAFATTATIGVFAGAGAFLVMAVRARIAQAEADLCRAEADLCRTEADRQRLARKTVEAELQVMRAQIEPHFLFNTLANLSFLIKSDPDAAFAMLDNLIEYLHASMPRMRGQENTLKHELAMCGAYLSILRIRMGERLTSDIDAPAELQDIPFPPMMLITLVENAIKHGLDRQPEGGVVTVSATRLGDFLQVVVADTGAGLKTPPTQSCDGVGLTNIRERLNAIYGDRATLRLAAHVPRGTVATIAIPLDA